MKVKSESEVTQSCLTPSDPMDCSLPGSSVHGIFQARVLEWVAIKECSNYRTIALISHVVTEKAMATHSSTLAWKIPWTEEPGRLQSTGSQESDTTERLHFLFTIPFSMLPFHFCFGFLICAKDI